MLVRTSLHPSRLLRGVSMRPRGISMMEILITLAVILILSSMIMQGMTQMNRARKLSNSTETVAAAISQARRLAISDNRIYHVRIENLGPADQYVSVYRFKKLSDALQAVNEDAVQTLGGWGTEGPGPVTNDLVLRRKLETGVLFETEYDPANLFTTTGSKKAKSTYSVALHPKDAAGMGKLFYTGPAGPSSPYPPSAPGTAAVNVLPQTSSTPYYTPTGMFTGTMSNTVLSFNPDGSASANVLLITRDDFALQFVQVWKGGIVRTGDLQSPGAFGQQIK